MKPYRLLIAYEVFEFIQGLPRQDQKAIHVRLAMLREYPHNQSDFIEQDEAGRDFQLNLRGKYAIKYWIDEAAREVKILSVQQGDRAR